MTIRAAAAAFATLLVTVGPIEVASVFTMLTASAKESVRRRPAVEACLLGGAVLVAFAFIGNGVEGGPNPGHFDATGCWLQAPVVPRPKT
jgi:small neutral amino acid transporter SnatA (MarC family)